MGPKVEQRVRKIEEQERDSQQARKSLQFMQPTLPANAPAETRQVIRNSGKMVKQVQRRNPRTENSSKHNPNHTRFMVLEAMSERKEKRVRFGVSFLAKTHPLAWVGG
jgi:hypothetical protein